MGIMINYVYEFLTFCTSVIVRLPDGTIVHGRNLDFNFAKDMQSITYEAHYIKNGRLAFKAI